jgi:hypothetical protein
MQLTRKMDCKMQVLVEFASRRCNARKIFIHVDATLEGYFW